jgi:twitching motility protein PilT
LKTLQQMLRELVKPEIQEIAVATDRLPCVKVGGKYEPIDEKARSTETILEMLVAAGGSRYVDEMESRPAAWTTRIEGVGSVGVQAVSRDGRVQARFVLIRRMSGTAVPAAQKQAPAKPPSRKSIPAPKPPSRKSIPVPKTQSRKSSVPALRLPKASKAPPPVEAPGRVEEGASPPPIAALFDGARAARASDLHLVSGRPMLLRVRGELTARGEPIDEATVAKMVMPLVPERLAGVLAEQGSCDFALDRGGKGRLRVNVARQRTGLKACFRLVSATVPTLESLGLPPEIEKATHHHQGLVVVTGPTGHGKTSTLAAIVDIINRETTHHVITVEDPVEVLHPRKKAMITQREVGTHTRSFGSALKASLREDPDVIVVGELRDTETVRMALAASETGHLVLGTMNTPSAAKTIDRLVDLFPPADQQQVRMTLAGGLHLIVSQRLLPSADGNGMVVAVELLPGSIALWALIRDNKTFQIPSLQQRGKAFGILRRDDSLHDLVRAGRVTREAALAEAEFPDELDAVLSGRKPPPETVAGKLFGKRDS